MQAYTFKPSRKPNHIVHGGDIGHSGILEELIKLVVS